LDLKNVSLEELTDESLMERVQQNDHQAFSVLVERRTNMFYAAAFRMVINKETAEDIVQEAFLKIWDKPQIWKKGKRAKFTTWFYRIVMNLSVDKLRKFSKESAVELDENLSSGMSSQEQDLVLDEEQQVLKNAIKTLPEKQLMALNLCFYEEVSNKEAADIMKVNIKALESLLMRAKVNLKNELMRMKVMNQEGVA
jgi:RNA polymerase sigma-70 factor (ECF subfamily)